MKSIQDTIDKLMDQHSIKFYVDLLIKIGKQLGIEDPYDFANKEKSNFTKMLKGQRPLKHDYIIPLEKIFGVPMAKMLYEEEYNTNFSKEDLPYIKGFRYYAYKDDPKLYYGEFEQNLVDVEGCPIICNTDEYNKWFLDYIVEYKAINGLRYLIDKHNLRSDPICNSQYYNINEGNGFNGSMIISIKYGLDYLIAEEDLVDVFEKMYDLDCVYIHFRQDGYDSVFKDDRFIQSILKSNKIFDSLFKSHKIDFTYANRGLVPNQEQKNKKIEVLNPALNLCLNYALKHLDDFKEQAKRILEFGIKYNKRVLDETGEKFEDLNTREFGNVCFGVSYELLTTIVYPEVEVDDSDINSFINKLPCPKYMRF